MNASWLKYMPEVVRARLAGRSTLQAVLGNWGWLFADKMLRILVGLFISVWIARYLGPEQFGHWNYAIAFSALFSAFASLGLDSIVVRDLVRQPDDKDTILGSAFVLKLAGGIIALAVSIIAMVFVRDGDPNTLLLVFIASAGYVFQAMGVIDFFFQAEVKSKYTVIASNCAFLITACLKIGLLIGSAPLLAFALVGLAEIVLTSGFLVAAYVLNHGSIRKWQYNRQVACRMLSDSWPLIFASIAILVQARIDQVMLGNMVGNNEVGQYSAAMRLIEMFAFIPMIVSSTLAPYIARAKLENEGHYQKRLTDFYRLMFIAFLFVAVPIYFLGEWVVTLLYGTGYQRAGWLLTLFAIRLFFANFGVAKSLYMTNESLFKYSLVTAIFGAAINIIGNYTLIPLYQSEGAVIASVLSFAVTVFIVDGFFKKTRLNLQLMALAICTPHRINRTGEN